MESTIHPDHRPGEAGTDRLHSPDGSGIVTDLARYIKQDWAGLYDHIITALGKRAYVVRIKGFVSREEPKLLALCTHHQLVLFGVHGDGDDRERLVGYCLLFGGAPIIHHYTRYLSLSYSEPEDIRARQMLVVFDDPNVRLTRLGVGTFDYLWCCRKQQPQQQQIDVADHAAAMRFSGTWKDGI